LSDSGLEFATCASYRRLVWQDVLGLVQFYKKQARWWTGAGADPRSVWLLRGAADPRRSSRVSLDGPELPCARGTSRL